MAFSSEYEVIREQKWVGIFLSFKVGGIAGDEEKLALRSQKVAEVG